MNVASELTLEITKRCSGLYRNIERLAEKTNPPRKWLKSNRKMMRETQDSLVRDALESSASVVNCVGGSNGDLPTEMALSDTDDIVTLLQNNSAEYITNMIPGELKIGTSPIGDAYGCMLTTRMIPVLNNLQGFVRKFQYPNVSETLQSEWGGVNNIRFFVSEQGSVSANASLAGNDVANCFVSAKEAYKVVRLRPDHYKFYLIDLEAYGESYGDKAQASERIAA